jgi:hypothetical protein
VLAQQPGGLADASGQIGDGAIRTDLEIAVGEGRGGFEKIPHLIERGLASHAAFAVAAGGEWFRAETLLQGVQRAAPGVGQLIVGVAGLLMAMTGRRSTERVPRQPALRFSLTRIRLWSLAGAQKETSDALQPLRQQAAHERLGVAKSLFADPRPTIVRPQR